jgi:hypothetical protein
MQPLVLGELVGRHRARVTPREQQRVAKLGIAESSEVIHL